MIRVYDDEGVGQKPLQTLFYELSDWEYSTISAKEITEGRWEKDTKLLIIPGGRDVPYHEALSGAGNARIRSFVENGGSFLGICAGGYYGSARVEFDQYMPLEVVEERELCFFPGTARGPAFGPGTFFYNSERGAKAAKVLHSGEVFKTYYNGGCYFVEAENHPQINTVSKYLDIPEEPAAIIECSIGEGKAILSGVHFEIGLADPRTTIPRKLKAELADHENTRRKFFQRTIDSLLE